MRVFTSAIVAAALLVTGSRAAHAATVLDSQALEAETADALGLCRLVNLGAKQIDVFVEQLDASGVVTTSEHRTAAPGATIDNFTSSAPGTFRCRFSGTFAKAKVQALVAVLVNGNMTASVPVR